MFFTINDKVKIKSLQELGIMFFINNTQLLLPICFRDEEKRKKNPMKKKDKRD
jgi:hypothetical protein